MAIDVRANVTCSLGEIITAGITDSYAPERGLILTSGTVIIDGLILPDVGLNVTFSYLKNGITRTIPRALRVISAVPDPFRRTTEIKLGCLLTYLSDLREPITIESKDDPENSGVPSSEFKAITIPVHASSIFEYCLDKLDIEASENPLTNIFSTSEFSLSSGYVDTIDKLLVSESYIGYLDEDEILQIKSLDISIASTVSVFTKDNIVDMEPVNSGELPAQAVYVSYNSLKLANNISSNVNTTTGEDENQSKRNWEYEITETDNQEYVVTYRDLWSGANATQSFTGKTRTESRSNYNRIAVSEFDESTQKNKISYKDVVSNKTSKTFEPYAKGAASLISARLSDGMGYGSLHPSMQVEVSRTEEYYQYDSQGNQIESVSTTYEPEIFVALGADIPPAIRYISSFAEYLDQYATMFLVPTSRTEVFNNVINETSWTRRVEYKNTLKTAEGAGASSEGKQTFISMFDAWEFFLKNKALVYSNGQTTISGSNITEVRPSIESRTNAASAASTADPMNNYRTTSQAQLEFISGSTNAQRTITFTVPYSDDDRLVGSNGNYTIVTSDADTKALKYGRVQNALLVGGRSGYDLQILPEDLPNQPLSPIAIEINGFTGLYLCDGSNWAANASGILCSTNALFWGGIGQSDPEAIGAWFPLAPGIVTLPETPPVVDGQISITTIIPSSNEIIRFKSKIRSTCKVKGLPYGFVLQSNVLIYSPKINVTVESTYNNLIYIPSAQITINLNVPYIIQPIIGINVPAFNITLQKQVPYIDTPGFIAYIQATTIVALPRAPFIEIIRPFTPVNITSKEIALTILTPGISSGASIAVAVCGILVSANQVDIKTDISVPLTEVQLTVNVIQATAGGSIAIPVTEITLVSNAAQVATGASVIVSNVSQLPAVADNIIIRDILDEERIRNSFYTDIIYDSVDVSVVTDSSNVILREIIDEARLTDSFYTNIIYLDAQEPSYDGMIIAITLPVPTISTTGISLVYWRTLILSDSFVPITIDILYPS